MSIFNCLICKGDLDVVGEDGIKKIVRCKSCGYQSGKIARKKPEIVIIRKFEKNK